MQFHHGNITRKLVPRTRLQLVSLSAADFNSAEFSDFSNGGINFMCNFTY